MKKPIFNLAGLDGLRAKNRCPVQLSPGFVRVDALTPVGDAEVFVFGDIGGWFDGVVAEDFCKEIAALNVETLNVRVNSPGGLVFDGFAIYNALAAHSAKVVVHIEGIAASIASVIAMAGDEIRIGEAANVMIHKPWSGLLGDAEAFRKEADILDNLEAGIIGLYSARTGKDNAELADMMKAETWMRGQAAVDAGFADVVVPAKGKKKCAAKSALLSLYNHTPTDLLPENADEPKVREFERLLHEGEGKSNSYAKRVAAMAARVFASARDVPAPAPRDEDGPAISVADAMRLAAAVRSLIR